MQLYRTEKPGGWKQEVPDPLPCEELWAKVVGTSEALKPGNSSQKFSYSPHHQNVKLKLLAEVQQLRRAWKDHQENLAGHDRARALEIGPV